jgi:FMN-dependent NADH-azoreductase
MRKTRRRPLPGLTIRKGYIDFWLKFIGVKEVHTLVVEGTTWGGKEKGEESIARGQAEAKKLAADF